MNHLIFTGLSLSCLIVVIGGHEDEEFDDFIERLDYPLLMSEKR
jgi:hypothetical protein